MHADIQVHCPSQKAARGLDYELRSDHARGETRPPGTMCARLRKQHTRHYSCPITVQPSAILLLTRLRMLLVASKKRSEPATGPAGRQPQRQRRKKSWVQALACTLSCAMNKSHTITHRWLGTGEQPGRRPPPRARRYSAPASSGVLVVSASTACTALASSNQMA
jgi:hypothetical protein